MGCFVNIDIHLEHVRFDAQDIVCGWVGGRVALFSTNAPKTSLTSISDDAQKWGNVFFWGMKSTTLYHEENILGKNDINVLLEGKKISRSNTQKKSFSICVYVEKRLLLMLMLFGSSKPIQLLMWASLFSCSSNIYCCNEITNQNYIL